MEIDNPYSIILTNKEIILQHMNLSTNNPIKILSINPDNNLIKVENSDYLEEKIIYKNIKVKAILGIIQIINKNYILYVKSSDKVGKINNEEIWAITEVDFFEISLNNKKEETKEIKQIKDGISKLLKLGFYYSFGFNLTNSLQNQSKILYNLKKKKKFHINDSYNIDNNNIELKLKKIFITSNKKYFFNYNLYKYFINKETNEPIDYNFIMPIICGYVGMFDYMLNGKFFQFILISRRSQNFAGTRYNTRGINDEGNVANFCETEHILIFGDTLCSFSQLRGSAPVFFDQIGFKANTDITRNKELSIQAFSKHLKEMMEDYDLICFINLLNQKKSKEAPIIEEFEKQIKFRQNNNNIRYKFFDMQNECKKDDYSKIDILMYKISKLLNLFNFFSIDITTEKVLSIQNGTTRTNCLDCLDRTNVIESRISWLFLEKIFIYLKFDDKDIQFLFNKKEKFFAPSKNTFKENFKDIWAENGDLISIQYAGTASTITTVTKTGGHNLKGIITHGVATVSRFYQGTFEDLFKQECFDIFLQKNFDHLLLNLDPNIKKELLSRKNEYIKYIDLNIFIGNYNLSGKSLNDPNDIINWLIIYKGNPLNKDIDLHNIFPDFYILGFEDIIESSIFSKSNKEKKNSIKQIITDILSKIYQPENNDSYQLMEELDYHGLYLLIFVKASCIKYVKKIESKIIKSSLMENNGSLLIRFNLNDSKICFSCSQLTSGQDKIEERKKEIIDILNTNFKKYESRNFKDYDFYFLFGNLNIRLNKKINEQMKNDLFKNHAVETDYEYDKFLEFDQFYNYLKEDSIISQMKEPPIKFSPTYKYYIGKSEYDKKSIPSWCDRIFYKKNSDIIPLAYNKFILNYSEHQPIFGVFKIKSELINEKKQYSILNQIIKEKNGNNNNI